MSEIDESRLTELCDEKAPHVPHRWNEWTNREGDALYSLCPGFERQRIETGEHVSIYVSDLSLVGVVEMAEAEGWSLDTVSLTVTRDADDYDYGDGRLDIWMEHGDKPPLAAFSSLMRPFPLAGGVDFVAYGTDPELLDLPESPLR